MGTLYWNHWIALHAFDKNVTYFDCFGVKHISEKFEKFINNKNIKTNIF